MRQWCIIAVLALSLGGCTWGDSDSAGSASQGIDVHCGAQTPTGSTTVKVDCPPQ